MSQPVNSIARPGVSLSGAVAVAAVLLVVSLVVGALLKLGQPGRSETWVATGPAPRRRDGRPWTRWRPNRPSAASGSFRQDFGPSFSLDEATGEPARSAPSSTVATSPRSTSSRRQRRRNNRLRRQGRRLRAHHHLAEERGERAMGMLLDRKGAAYAAINKAGKSFTGPRVAVRAGLHDLPRRADRRTTPAKVVGIPLRRLRPDAFRRPAWTA